MDVQERGEIREEGASIGEGHESGVKTDVDNPSLHSGSWSPDDGDETVQALPRVATYKAANDRSGAATAATSSDPLDDLDTLSPEERIDRLASLIETILDAEKAEDIVSIGLAGKTPMADHLVVASGRSQRHVGAMADHLVRKLKDAGFGTARVEGLPQCDWVLIDCGDVVVHLFRPEVRDFYRLEKMWQADIPAESLNG